MVTYPERMDGWLEWQKKYRYGTLVLWPPDAVRQQVNALRQRYDPESQRICETHITLTQPLLRGPTEVDWRALQDVVAACSPFTIQYGPLGTFLPYPCIYYAIEPAQKVLALRADVHATGLCNLSLPLTEGFVPHMSLNDGRPDEQATRAIYRDLTQNPPPNGAFHCHDVAYIVPDETFAFTVARRLPMADEPTTLLQQPREVP